VLLVDIDDFSRLRTQFEKTSFYKLYKDPAMAPFVEDFRDNLDRKIKQADNEFLNAIFQPDALPQARVALALVLDEQAVDFNEPPVLVIAQWGRNLPQVKEAINKIIEKAVADGAGRKSEDYRGAEIITVRKSDAQSNNYCFLENTLFVSTRAEYIKFVIAQIKGAAGPTLADDNDYIATMKAVGLDRHIDLYVNIKQIIKTVIAEDAAGKTKTIITNLGLVNVRSIGGSVSLAPRSGESLAGRAFVKIDGERKGICRMFEFDSAPLRAPKFLPDNVYSLAFINLNIKKSYDVLSGIVRSFSPAAAAILYMPIVPPSLDGRPGLQLKTDIIDHLGSQIIIARSATEPRTSDAAPAPETLVALAVSNRGALERSLSRLHGLFSQDNPDAKRQLLGYTIYLLDLSAFLPIFTPGAMTPMQDPLEVRTQDASVQPGRSLLTGQVPSEPTSPGFPPMPKAAFTITDTHLILGVEPTVERAIRTLSAGGTASADFAKWFNKAKSTIPDVVGLAGLENDAVLAEILWKTMKNAGSEPGQTGTSDAESRSSIGLSVSSSSGLMFSQGGLVDLFDYALLPEFDAVRKYFGLSTYYVITRPNGFFQEFKYIDPAQQQ